MNRLLLFLTGLALVIVPEGRGQGLSFGVHGGLNSANISTDDPELADRTSLSGYVAGGFVTIDLPGIFGVQVEGLYSQKGVNVSLAEGDARIHVDYIEIPLLARIGVPGLSGIVRPYVLAGVAFGFASDCWLYDSSDATEWDCDEVDFEIRSKDTGILAGAEVRVLRGPFLVTAGGRRAWGLKSVDALNDAVSTTNRVWSFLLGVGVRFGS